MKASRGKSIFAAFLLTSGVQRRLSHLYMDDLSEKLKECKTGNCGVGLTIWWCLLITLLKVMVCNMTLNLTLRRVLSILLKNQGGSKGKTFLHSLRQMLWTKSDIWVISFGVSCCMWWRQCCKLCAQANMPACKFQMCTDDVKTALFYSLLYSTLHT